MPLSTSFLGYTCFFRQTTKQHVWDQSFSSQLEKINQKEPIFCSASYQNLFQLFVFSEHHSKDWDASVKLISVQLAVHASDGILVFIIKIHSRQYFLVLSIKYEVQLCRPYLRDMIKTEVGRLTWWSWGMFSTVLDVQSHLQSSNFWWLSTTMEVAGRLNSVSTVSLSKALFLFCRYFYLFIFVFSMVLLHYIHIVSFYWICRIAMIIKVSLWIPSNFVFLMVLLL